jgi:hypothetical protein
MEGRFSGGTVNLWTGIGETVWNGKTWTGAGNLAGASQIEETSDIKAVGVNVSLSGIPAELLSLVLQSIRGGDQVDLWLLAMDLSTGAIIGDPDDDLIFSGRADVPEITEDPAGPSISLALENRLIDLERARERRYTPEDQHIDYPGDKGFDYVASLQQQDIVWGRS